MQCMYDEGGPEHRVCKFKNLLIYESNIHYVYTGTLSFVAHCSCLTLLFCSARQVVINSIR